MLRILTLLLAVSGFLLSPGASAVCTLARGTPTTLNIPAQVIHLAADAPVDTSTPIAGATYDSNALSAVIGYDNCQEGTPIGKRPMNLGPQNTSTKIYPTNISGLGVKLLFSNGSMTDFGDFPSNTTIHFNDGKPIGTSDFNPGPFFRIEFYKTGKRINLTNPAGDTVLPAGELGYYFIIAANPANYVMKLAIGEIKVVSTPACTMSGTQTVDFNEVTPSLLKAGVTRPLDFQITCQSDYGAYSVKASMTTNTPSSDASYIRAKDANGNLDRLGIKITDTKGNPIKVNGTNTEDRPNVTSMGPAEYAWNAEMVPGAKATPAGGTFSAEAEIVFDIQ